jgi:hypothetical protein
VGDNHFYDQMNDIKYKMKMQDLNLLKQKRADEIRNKSLQRNQEVIFNYWELLISDKFLLHFKVFFLLKIISTEYSFYTTNSCIVITHNLHRTNYVKNLE